MKSSLKTVVGVLALMAHGVAEAQTPFAEFRSKEGRFSILMPGRPGLQKQSVSTGVGAQTLYTYTASSIDPLTGRPLGYIVVFTDTPKAGIGKNPAKFLDAVRNGFVAKRNGKVLSQKKVTMAGVPGQEFRMEDPAGFEYLSRLCLVKNRLYQVIVMAPRGRMAWAQGGKFLGSFRLIKG